MRHRNSSQRLGYKADVVAQMMRNMVTSVILYERIRTTKKRAQVMRPLLDKVISMSKSLPTGLAIRRLSAYLSDENASRKLLEVLKQRYKTRPSGFSRVVPVGQRHGDGALLVDVILLDSANSTSAPQTEEKPEVSEKKAPKKAAKKTVAKKKASA